MKARAAGAEGRVRLVADGLACGYAADRPILEVDVIAEGRRPLVIAGRSGAGRSTLAQALAGFMPRLTGGWRRGHIALALADGQIFEQNALDPAAWLAHVGWYSAPPHASLTGARRTVLGEVAFALEQRGLAPGDIAARARAGLAAIGLSALAERDPGTLSDGEAARLALGSVLIAEPAALVLDDPEAYLDGAGLRDVLGLLGGGEASPRAIVLSTARPSALADAAPGWLATADAMILGGGRVALAGQAYRVLASPDDLHHGVFPCLALAAVEGTVLRRSARRPFEAAGEPLAALAALADGAWGGVLAPAGGPLDVTVDDIVVTYGGQPALRGVSLMVAAGSVTALVGANGGGKSTLLRVLAGLVTPVRGRARVGDVDPLRLDRPTAARRVALVGSRPDDQPAARTVAADIALGLAWTGVDRAARPAILDAVLAASGLTGRAAEHPQEVPAGDRRWRSLAAALVLRSPVILLDEPTVGLDADGQLRLEAAIGAWRRQGRTVIVASHDLDFVAEVAGRAIVLAGGRVCADAPTADVLTDADSLAAANLIAPARLFVARALGVPATGAGSRAAVWRAVATANQGGDDHA